MRKNEFEKIGNIIDRLLKNSDKIVNGLIVLLFISILSCYFWAHNLPLPDIYVIILILQLLVISEVIVFSYYIRVKTWGKELTGEKAGTLSDEEKAMKSCEYKSDEVEWIDAKKIASNALSEFKLYWLLIWCSWFVFYIVYFIRHYLGNNTQVIDFFLNPLSNVNTLMLLICYLILFEITLADEQTGISAKPNWAPWASLFLIITFAEILIRSLAQSNVTSRDYIEIFNWINGITSGAVMALFVGAFDNEFIKPKLVYPALLYLYMAVQAIFPIILNDGQLSLAIFNNDEKLRLAIKLLVSVTTLVCKTTLFLFVFKQIESGRLLFYFIRIRKQHYDFDDKWDEFLKLPEIAGEKGAAKMQKWCKVKRNKSTTAIRRFFKRRFLVPGKNATIMKIKN